MRTLIAMGIWIMIVTALPVKETPTVREVLVAPIRRTADVLGKIKVTAEDRVANGLRVTVVGVDDYLLPFERIQ